jgi:N-acylglucosamine 2-epimerase
MAHPSYEYYLEIYRNGLVRDILPFWVQHSVDREYGGFMFSLNRDGSLLDTDKGMWQTCRFTWLLATMYNEWAPNEEWLKLAHSGIDFISRFGFDTDGRMFFHVTRDGAPIRKRRYIFTETFGAIAYAALYRATQLELFAQKARDLFDLVVGHITQPVPELAKYSDTRPMKSLAIPMIMTVTAQELRKNLKDDSYTHLIDKAIREIKTDFMKHEFRAVLENVGSDGSFHDHFDGRILCPGHAIEAAWFILQEAYHRNQDQDLLNTGLTILDWMWEKGWDEEFGGLYYFRDVRNLPVQEYWHDMKFWWPHNETIIATLMAYQLSGDPKYLDWHRRVHDWTYRHFPDPEYGEWFGYLHRDGRLSVPLKGNLWKGPFHIPRMQMVASKILETIIEQRNPV